MTTGSLVVTGGAGFIGSSFRLAWLERFPEDRRVVRNALTYEGTRVHQAARDRTPEFTFAHGAIGEAALEPTVEWFCTQEKWWRPLFDAR